LTKRIENMVPVALDDAAKKPKLRKSTSQQYCKQA